MTDIEIIDNHLSDYYCDSIFKAAISKDFPWYYVHNLNDRDYLGNYYFSNCLIDNFRMRESGSWTPIMMPIMDKLSIPLNRVKRLKINLSTRAQFIDRHQPHYDYHKDSGFITYLYYANSCNGYTGFPGKGKIKSKKNRLAIFDGSNLHYSTNCTDANARVTVNFDVVAE